MRKNYVLITAIAAISLTANAFTVDWNRIQHWAGAGENKAALVVQFTDGKEEKAYIWGYRWPAGSVASGEDMFRTIASESNDIYLFTQYTGWMGNTVCGIGVSPENTVAEHLIYDFDSAQEDPNISFNWFSANTLLGQTDAPGWDTPEICAEAIENAKETNILEHPVNAKRYGYACYDYDYWQVNDDDADIRWHAGWYKGYWSYWVGGENSETLSYSGLGYTSRKLSDGDVDAWKYQHLDGSAGGEMPDGYTGASTPWHELDYTHFSYNASVTWEPEEDTSEEAIYRLDGTRLPPDASHTPGIYLKVKGHITQKIIIH